MTDSEKPMTARYRAARAIDKSNVDASQTDISEHIEFEIEDAEQAIRADERRKVYAEVVEFATARQQLALASMKRMAAAEYTACEKRDSGMAAAYQQTAAHFRAKMEG